MSGFTPKRNNFSQNNNVNKKELLNYFNARDNKSQDEMIQHDDTFAGADQVTHMKGVIITQH
jgi:hypothetical protein